MTKTVVAVSDTVLGYGSSQVLSITKGLANLIGGDHLIFQPFVPHRKFIDLNGDGYCIETVTSIEHPWSWIGRMQYLRRIALWINEHQPDVLLLPNYNMMPVIDLLRYRPKKIVHLALEDLDQFGQSYWGRIIVRKIKQLVSQVDLWIFPEENRAVHDCNQLDIPFNRMCIFYNVVGDAKPSLPAKERNGRIVYAGSVDFNRSAAFFFSSPQVVREAIDVFGSLGGEDQRKQDFLKAIAGDESKIRYFGEVSAETLAQRLPKYSYSLVYWFPATWALRNAAPNKFFQAVASGVPVLSAPHPQCVSLIRRFGCGVVLKDWDYGTFVSGLTSSIRKIGTDEYREMVSGCRDAFVKELNWERQFEKLVRMFDKPTRLSR